MIQRRSAVAGFQTKIGNHTFRATGITAYLKNKGVLEHAQTIHDFRGDVILHAAFTHPLLKMPHSL